MRMNSSTRLTVVALAALVALAAAPPSTARADDDGYDSPFAQAVRTATQPYRLVTWARGDHYVQTTDYVDGVGLMFTNHDRFDPPDLAHPTMLVYDEAGRLVACGYQFLTGAQPPAAFGAVPASAWYEIPRCAPSSCGRGCRIRTGSSPARTRCFLRRPFPDEGWGGMAVRPYGIPPSRRSFR